MIDFAKYDNSQNLMPINIDEALLFEWRQRLNPTDLDKFFCLRCQMYLQMVYFSEIFCLGVLE